MTEIMDEELERKERLREAFRKQDQTYLQQYERGLADGEAGGVVDAKVESSQAYQDGHADGLNRWVSKRWDKIEEGDGKIKIATEEDLKDLDDEPSNDQEEPFMGSAVQVGLHPLGGLTVSLRQPDGSTGEARVTVQEAWELAGSLQAHSAMLIQAAYVQMAQVQQQAMQKPTFPDHRRKR